jgi:hypothetical protein
MVKVALVVAGYVTAFCVAWAAVAAHDATLDPVTAQGGMAAFGDAILFLGVLGVASVPATAALLFFLRPVAWFWTWLGGIALALSATGVLASGFYVFGRTAPAQTALGEAASASVLRMIVAPLFALAFLVAGVVAPSGRSRIVLLAATVVEGAAFAAALTALLFAMR